MLRKREVADFRLRINKAFSVILSALYASVVKNINAEPRRHGEHRGYTEKNQIIRYSNSEIRNLMKSGLTIRIMPVLVRVYTCYQKFTNFVLLELNYAESIYNGTLF